MRAPLAFAWRSLVRQPARAALAILGVAAVGALLLDMLLLSEGLVLSMRELLDRMGFDIRVTAVEALPGSGPDLTDAPAAAAAIAALPGVRAVRTIRSEGVELWTDTVHSGGIFLGVGGEPAQLWTILRGRDLAAGPELVISEYAADLLHLEPGDTVTVRASCDGGPEAPPPATFRVAGIVELPFDTPDAVTAGTTLASLEAACGVTGGIADFLAVASTGDADAAAARIRAARPDLRVFTNDEMIGLVQQGGFTYFRQISTVLTAVTVSFALLLITVLLTVSVNQRLAEVAALRALGFSRRRVVLDVLCESALIIGLGGALSLPLGLLLASWLDTILKRMPAIPAQIHFFVLEPQALAAHAALLAATALVAAVYPMQIVARLPIAATLRNEVIS
ncbi:MAG: FtsX-like permease family protein [Acidobacteria bacterium]|nr:FtsX-like permease family protein [Acidobacteriota bacterium]